MLRNLRYLNVSILRNIYVRKFAQKSVSILTSRLRIYYVNDYVIKLLAGLIFLTFQFYNNKFENFGKIWVVATGYV